MQFNKTFDSYKLKEPELVERLFFISPDCDVKKYNQFICKSEHLCREFSFFFFKQKACSCLVLFKDKYVTIINRLPISGDFYFIKNIENNDIVSWSHEKVSNRSSKGDQCSQWDLSG